MARYEIPKYYNGKHGSGPCIECDRGNGFYKILFNGIYYNVRGNTLSDIDNNIPKVIKFSAGGAFTFDAIRYPINYKLRKAKGWSYIKHDIYMYAVPSYWKEHIKYALDNSIYNAAKILLQMKN